MKLHAMGISYKHDSSFRIERPAGSGDNLLLIFKTDAAVCTEKGMINVPPDSAVVYSCGSPQIYGSSGNEYENHWVHFECDETDIFFGRIGLKFNTPVSVTDISSAESILHMLSLESVSENSSAECSDLLLRLLLAKTAGVGAGSAKSPHSEKLKRIRAEIYSTPSGKFAIEALAEKMSLSPSHFQALYKSQFGVSCYEDVLRAKISSAKHYLKNTSLSVREISELCGYENYVHFIRQFRQRTGMTAAEYRKSPSGEIIS